MPKGTCNKFNEREVALAAEIRASTDETAFFAVLYDSYALAM